MVNLQHLLRIVIWVSLVVLTIDLLLVLFILRRRLTRWLYFKKKDAAARQFSGPIQGFLAGNIPVEDLVATLRTVRSGAGRDAIRDLLVDSLTGSGRKAVTDVLFRLGFIETWAKEAFGQRRSMQLIQHIVRKEELPAAPRRGFARIRRIRLFCVKRARAVTVLGHLDAAFAQVFMREALHDPSHFVGRANVVAMGHNQQGFELPVLLELLLQAVKGSSDLPVTAVKTAVVRYPIGQLGQFVPFLDEGDPRYRFVLVDSIREICDGAKATLSAKDFPENLYHWFLDHAALDESIDVRARSARVVRHFHDAAAILTLRALMLDKNEFVRLHAVRACADPYYSELIGDITRRIIDPKWRVREASVKTLATFGKAGRRQLASYFLDTTDQYASEQMVEEMQRSGIITEMLPALCGENGESTLVTGVCAKMVRMGKTSLLTDLLGRETRMSVWATASPSAEPVTRSAQRARAQLLEILLASPTPQLMATVRTLAARKDDDLSGKAQAVLETSATPVRRGTYA
ncbi:MAG TPA: HEAT repeat domain-containing protein [Candidatus Angelobacter sp.]|nr:HEAT repeat domain-containing protein [Candidatus Angelobacter sp.]